MAYTGHTSERELELGGGYKDSCFPFIHRFDHASDMRVSLRSIFCTHSINFSFLYSLMDLFSYHLTCSY